MRLLLIESDSVCSRAISLLLRRRGWDVDIATSGDTAAGLIARAEYRLLLAATQLPDGTAADLIGCLRGAGIATPVLVLCSGSERRIALSALRSGADDFLTKPFANDELLARIDAVLRRASPQRRAILSAGSIRLDLDSREVWVGDAVVPLTAKEYSMLELLMLRKGTPLTKDAFLTHLYGGMDEPELKIIDVFICKLRKKLAQAGAADVIGTVWGRGYMLQRGSEADNPACPKPGSTARVLEHA